MLTALNETLKPKCESLFEILKGIIKIQINVPKIVVIRVRNKIFKISKFF